MSAHQSLLCRDLVLEKQHRCSYTGGKAIYSNLGNNWIACLNNSEITILSTINGEIIINCNAIGECVQRLSPLNKTISNSQEMDNILTFDVSLNDKFIAISTRHHFIRIIKLIYNNQHEIIDLQLQNEFKTHINSVVRILIFNLNSELIIGGTGDGSVIIWNVINGFILHKFNKAHFLPITVLKMNTNKHYELISGSSDTRIKCYNLRKQVRGNNKIKTLSNVHTSPIMDIEFIGHKNSELMISIAMNDCVVIWDITTDKYTKLNMIHTKYSFTNILSLNKHSNGMLLLGDESGAIHYYEINDKFALNRLKKQDKQICQSALTNMCHMNDNDMMITSVDCNFYITNVLTGDIKRILIGYNDEMLDIAPLDENNLVLASNSCNLKVFNFKTFDYKLLLGHSEIIMSVAVDYKNKIIASASKDKTIRYWQWPQHECIGVIPDAHNGSVINVIENVIENIFISGAADGDIKLWNMNHLNKALMTVTEHNDEVNDIDISINKQYIVSCGSDSKINLYEFMHKNDDISMSHIQSTSYRKGKIIYCVRFSKNDKLIASSHNNGQIRLWDMNMCQSQGLKCVKVLQSINNSPILSFLFINYSTQIISTSCSGVLSIWSLKESQTVKEYKNHYDKIWKIIQLNEENKYLSIGCDSIINIWNDKTGENEKNKLKDLHKIQINKTKINNFIHNKQYKNAVKLCLKLDEPQKLFGLLLREYQTIENMEDIICDLDAQELSLLITYLIDFNTGSSRYCFLCQSLLNIIYSSFDINDLLKLQLNKTLINEKKEIIDLNVPEILISDKKQNFAQLNSALIAYTNRHLKRVDKLLLNLSIIDSLI